MEIVDLRAIAVGYDTSLVEAVGGAVLLEGANMQAINIKTSNLAKEAKADMAEAKKLAKTDRNAAIKKFDSAISKLEKLKKECESIEDDHLAMIFVDSFIKAFVPIFAGTLLYFFMPGPVGAVGYMTGLIGGYVCGLQKTLDFSAAVEKKMTDANKAGADGKYDASTWWKAGETRGATMIYFDRLITACKQAKSQLK